MRGKWKFTYDFLCIVNSNYMARKHHNEDTAVSKNLWPWFDLSRSSKVKCLKGKWKFTYDFLSVGNSIYVANKHRFEDTAVWKYHDLGLTFQGHPRSKVMRGNESSHMTSYLLVMVFMWLWSTVLKIQLFENIVTSLWPFKVNLGQR